jgi:hypothetical protein
MMLLTPDRISSVFWTVVIVLVAVQVVPSSGDIRAGLLFTLVLGGAVAVVWHLQQQRDRTSATVDKTIQRMADRDGSSDNPLDNDMYVLRNVHPSASRPLKHLAMRPHVERAVARLRSHVERDGGKVGRLLACLEDFYARFDAALLGSPTKAARSVRNLLDLRAEAINTMHTLVFARPDSTSGRAIRAGIEAVRSDTQRCLAALAARHAGSADVAAAEWRPPYANDPRRDPRYHVAV